MAVIILPGIPDILGKSVQADPQLLAVLLAMKITIEKLTGATVEELDELLNKNN
jgi:hypothetical protein